MAALVETPSATAMTDSLHRSGRHHKKKDSDPFLQLVTDDGKPSDLPLLSTEHEGSHSLFADVILAPLTMVSFLLSLSLVDRQQRQWRLSQQTASVPDSFWTRLTQWSWLDPQPYQEPQNSTWRHDRTAATQSSASTAYKGWYTRKKHRAIAKMEMSDAFDMRGRVVLAMIIWTILGLFTLTYAVRRTYAWLVA